MQRSTAIDRIRGFNRYYTNTIGLLDRHILRSPYSLTEVRIMFEISSVRHCTARSIMRALAVDEGYLSRTIDKLEKLGLITRVRSSGDRRAFLLAMSERGRKEFLGLNKAAGLAIVSMTSHLSDGELVEIVSHMQRVRELLERRENNRERES